MDLATVEHERAERFRQNLCIALFKVADPSAIDSSQKQETDTPDLLRFARTLADNVRKFDLVGRYGDQTFIVLFANTDLVQASNAVQRLTGILDKPESQSGDTARIVKFTCGFAVLQQDASLQDLISIADKTLKEKQSHLS